MSIQILENTPHSLKLRSSNLVGFFVGLFFVSILFLFSGVMLIQAVVHLVSFPSATWECRLDRVAVIKDATHPRMYSQATLGNE